MLKTILLLLVGLVLLPLVAWHSDAPLSPEQKDMLFAMLKLMCGVALTCFIVSEITRNCSQVDKLWSIMPIVYTWYFAWSGAFDYRMTLVSQAWKVTDIVAENVSLVINYRGTFNTEISRSGIDGLIRVLETKNKGAQS